MPDILHLGGPNAGLGSGGSMVVVYDTANDVFRPEYNDPRSLASEAVGVGCGVSVERVWSVGSMVRYGYFGGMDSGYVPYVVTALDASVDMRTLPGYGAMSRHEFVGSAGNKALFVDRLVSPPLFQVYDADLGQWEGVIAGPTGSVAPGVTYGAEMSLTETGSIFFATGFGSSAPWTNVLAQYDGTWNVIAMDSEYNVGLGTPQIWCPDDDTVVTFHRRNSDSYWGYVGRWTRSGGWVDVVTDNLIPEGFSWASGALLDEGERLMIHGQNRRLMLIDLTSTNTRLGYSLMPTIGAASINYGPAVAGTSSDGFLVSWASTLASGPQSFAVRYDPGAVDEFHALVGSRGAPFGTFTGPDDAPVTSASWYYGLIGVWSSTSGMEAAQTGDLALTLTFSAPVDGSGASGAAVAEGGSYGVRTSAGAPVAAVSGVLSDDGLTVVLTLDKVPTFGATYSVEILSPDITSGGTPLQGESGEFVSNTSLPVVEDVVPTGPRAVEVSFSRDMLDNAALLDVTKYQLVGGPSVVSVSRVRPNAVSLELDSDALDGTIYQLTVLDTP